MVCLTNIEQAFQPRRKPSLPWLCVTALLLSSSACANKLAGDDIVVARVNGTPITRYELEQAAAKSLGRAGSRVLKDAKTREKVLGSLVQKRVIARAREAELGEADRLALQKELESYREELLVRQYLAVHPPPQPVRPEDIRQYYEKNKQQFGAVPVRVFELVGTERDLMPEERDRVLGALQKLASGPDWPAATEELRAKGFPTVYRTGEQEQQQLLDPALRRLIDSIDAGRSGGPTFVKGRAYVVRVKEVKTRQARPLEEVSDEIRERLEPVELRNALQNAGKRLLKNAHVEIIQQPQKKGVSTR